MHAVPAAVLTVPAAVTLTLAAGGTFYLNGGQIDVYGNLHAVGSPAQPITFTAWNGNSGGWNGIPR